MDFDHTNIRRMVYQRRIDFDHNNVGRKVEEDRLSSLPDELIHKILSSIDMKFVVQTCLLSSRWKLLWTSMPCLNFSASHFPTVSQFSRFVTLVLINRNHQAEVSLVKLIYPGAAHQDFVKKIAKYAFSRNVQELIIASTPKTKLADEPNFILSSQSLKNFKFISHRYSASITIRTPLNFPALTTLHLRGMVLTGDLFSKCVNLKNLTLKYFSVERTVQVFDIITPRLSTLILIRGRCSTQVINLIAPQLENLTIDNCSIKYLNAPPGLSSSLYYRGHDHHPPLSMDRLRSLKAITICLTMVCQNMYRREDAHKIINMLKELHSARYLTLTADMVECLWYFRDLLSHHPSPFSNLICLIIDSRLKNDGYKVKMSAEARNFFFENSPSATSFMKLPKGCQRLCQNEDVS